MSKELNIDAYDFSNAYEQALKEAFNRLDAANNYKPTLKIDAGTDYNKRRQFVEFCVLAYIYYWHLNHVYYEEIRAEMEKNDEKHRSVSFDDASNTDGVPF